MRTDQPNHSTCSRNISPTNCRHGGHDCVHAQRSGGSGVRGGTMTLFDSQGRRVRRCRLLVEHLVHGEEPCLRPRRSGRLAGRNGNSGGSESLTGGRA
jgi:hypothetical protein